MRYGNSTQTITHVGATTTGGGGGAGVPGPQGPAGAAGAAGADGDSAYAIAVANGFVGTEPQWLASLVGAAGAVGPQGPAGPAGPAGADGADGADGAIGPQGPAGPAGADGADGADGAIGPQGPAGSGGDSAYQIAQANGFTGTEAQWLDSLQASAEVITSSYTHTLSDLTVGETFYVSDIGIYKIWQGTGFIEFGKAIEPLSVDSLDIGDSSFADDPTSGTAGAFRYSDVAGDHLYIHDGTAWHHINGA